MRRENNVTHDNGISELAIKLGTTSGVLANWRTTKLLTHSIQLGLIHIHCVAIHLANELIILESCTWII